MKQNIISRRGASPNQCQESAFMIKYECFLIERYILKLYKIFPGDCTYLMEKRINTEY